jgi:outer membrane immunogenic protein
MKGISKTLLATTAICSLPVIAVAADLPLKAARPAARPTPAVVTSTWDGLYFGGHIGYGWTKFNSNYNDGDIVADMKPRGLVYGIHGGYNKQLTSNAVVGWEADLSSDAWDKKTAASNSGKKQQEGRTTGLASLRGRVGLTFNDNKAMVYATGGVGWARGSYMNAKWDKPSTLIDNYTRTGGVVGGGVEYKVNPRATVGVEGLYYFVEHKDTLTSPSGKKTITYGPDNVGVVRGRLSFNW